MIAGPDMMASTNVIDCADLFSEWQNKLMRTEKGKARAILANAMTAFRYAPEWQGLRYDEFAFTTYLVLPPPWIRDRAEWTPQAWSDDTSVRATEWMQRQGILVTERVVAAAAQAVALENAFHPVRDYLNGLQWDGHERIEAVMPEALGAEPTSFVRIAMRSTMIAAVARIMDPGCKVDSVLILEGPQGARKSTAIRALFGPWFSDDCAELGTKDAAMQVASTWCLELAELTSMRKPAVENIKAFISRRVDRFRPPYGATLIEAKRRCILIGTTNGESYLKDETGGRRFWPIRCNNINIEMLQQHRDQLWAEAVALYNAGEPWWLVDETVIEEAKVEADTRYIGDPWELPVAQALVNKVAITPEELFDALEIEKAKQGTRDQMRLAAILKRMGWTRRRTMRGGIRQTVYHAPDV